MTPKLRNTNDDSDRQEPELRRLPLLPTENFENTLPDGVMTINVFEFPSQKKWEGYDLFVGTIKDRLVDICMANPFLLGRLEQTKKFSVTSPLKGEFDLLLQRGLSRQSIERQVHESVFQEAPQDLTKGLFPSHASIESSPLVDLARFVASNDPQSLALGLDQHLSSRTYDGLSNLLKTTFSTAVPTGPESAQTQDSLFKVVVVPTPSRSHAFVVVSLSHAIADGNTYHRVLHMLLGSTDRRTGLPVPVAPLLFDAERDCKSSNFVLDKIIQDYKKERDAVVPEARLMDQMKLGGAIGVSAVGAVVDPSRALRNFVALVDLDELNRLKKEWSLKEHREAAGSNNDNKAAKLSANDLLVCELGKIMGVNRLDTNVDVRIKVLHERFGLELEDSKDAAGNCVAMLPFFRRHFSNPWYVRNAMTREDGRLVAPKAGDSKKNNKRTNDVYVAGNLSNWSGFTVGTQLGKQFAEAPVAAKLVLHLPINVTAGRTTPFEQALVFAPFQDQPKQLAVVFSTHYFDRLTSRIEDPNQKLFKPFVNQSTTK